MSKASERLTRRLAIAAVAIASVALVVAGYALWLTRERLHETREVSDALRSNERVPLNSPPPTLAD